MSKNFLFIITFDTTNVAHHYGLKPSYTVIAPSLDKALDAIVASDPKNFPYDLTEYIESVERKDELNPEYIVYNG